MSLVPPMPVVGAPVPTLVILRTMGCGLSTASSSSALCAMEKDTPSFTRFTACFRFLGVMRLIAPNWSSFPQRFQLESCVISCTKSSAVPSWLDAAFASIDEIAAAEKDAAAKRWITWRRDT